MIDYLYGENLLMSDTVLKSPFQEIPTRCINPILIRSPSETRSHQSQHNEREHTNEFRKRIRCDELQEISYKRVISDGIRNLSLDQSFSQLTEPTNDTNNNIDIIEESICSSNEVLPDINQKSESADMMGLSDVPISDELQSSYNIDPTVYAAAPLPILGQKHTRKVDLLVENLIRKERRLFELRSSMLAMRNGQYLDGEDMGIPHVVGPTPTVDQSLLSSCHWPVVYRNNEWTIDARGSTISLTTSASSSGAVNMTSGNCNGRSGSVGDYKGISHGVSIGDGAKSIHHSNDLTHSDWLMEFIDNPVPVVEPTLIGDPTLSGVDDSMVEDIGIISEDSVMATHGMVHSNGTTSTSNRYQTESDDSESREDVGVVVECTAYDDDDDDDDGMDI